MDLLLKQFHIVMLKYIYTEKLVQFRIYVTGSFIGHDIGSAFVKAVTVSCQELLNTSYGENKIWESLLTTWSNGYIKTKAERNLMITTYNGILADDTNLLGNSSETCYSILLLNKACLPEVDVAREKIIGFSLENAFNLSKIQKKLGILDDKSHFISDKDVLVTENKLFELLRDNPNLENEIWKDIDNEHTLPEYQKKLKSETTIKIYFNNDYPLRTRALFSVLKKYFTVYYKKADYYDQALYIGKKQKNAQVQKNFLLICFFRVSMSHRILCVFIIRFTALIIIIKATLFHSG